MGSADVTQPPPWQYPNSPTVNGGNVNLIGRPISLRQEILGQMGLGPAASGSGVTAGTGVNSPTSSGMPASGGTGTGTSGPSTVGIGGSPQTVAANSSAGGNGFTWNNGVPSAPGLTLYGIYPGANGGPPTYSFNGPSSALSSITAPMTWGGGPARYNFAMQPPSQPAAAPARPVHMAPRPSAPSAPPLQQQVAPTTTPGWPGLTASQAAPGPRRP